MFSSPGCVPEKNESLKETNPDKTVEMVIVPDAMVACLIDAGRIQYAPDAKGTDAWQTPAETVSRGKGDCEDICIYLQHLLRRKEIEVDVVFGLKTRYHKHGHCWCEYQQDGETYVIEPRTNAFYTRSRLPSFLYIRADDVDVVEKKVRAYHRRTGVWVSEAYRKKIKTEAK
ncbi:MAG: lasso peptide biosynthesis protein [Phycisphaerae bacterium]|nr:lasso peptide biosynthesis protein [Phycisphaerae bacterium]